MTGTEYQSLAMRTNDGMATSRLSHVIAKNTKPSISPILKNDEKDIGGILNACLGLSGEVGELNDMIKKWIFHNNVLDEVHAMKECGDILWYVAMMCEAFGWSMDDVMATNIDKLKKRYPYGFDTQRANNRKDGDV